MGRVLQVFGRVFMSGPVILLMLGIAACGGGPTSSGGSTPGGGGSTPPPVTPPVTTPSVVVTVTPKIAALAMSTQSQQFSATTTGDPQNLGVTWSVDGVA